MEFDVTFSQPSEIQTKKGLFAQEEIWQAQTMQGQTDKSCIEALSYAMTFMLGINEEIQAHVSNINCPEDTKGSSKVK